MNSDDIVFELKNIECKYNNMHSRYSLLIKRLNIPRGSKTFILGKSGSGKSTLIELLGLMNNVYSCGEDSVFTMFFDKKTHSKDLRRIWTNKNELNEIRLKYSFIFQKSNLMPDYSIYNNAIISNILKSEDHLSVEKFNEVMKSLKIQDKNFERLTSKDFSIGQQQRIAFASAIYTKFDILFGDEPTGNLDEKMSNELMSLICTSDKMKNKTAIIVSHNIDLALNYSDSIVLIYEKNDKWYVDDCNTYRKKGLVWCDLNNNKKTSKELRSIIINLL